MKTLVPAGSAGDRSQDTVDKHSRGRRQAWAPRVVLGLVFFFLAMAGLGFIYQAVSAAADARRYPPPGQMVDVGGF